MPLTNAHVYIKEKQLAELLGVSPAAIRRWRLERRGPSFVRVEGAVRYRLNDVEAYLASRTVQLEDRWDTRRKDGVALTN